MPQLFFKNTRLDTIQKMALETALDRVDATVYLFGSRVNPKARGGDVDILLVLNGENPDIFQTMMQVTKKYQNVCDEKIDVLVYPLMSKLNKEQQVFFDSIDKVCLTA